MTFFFFFLSLSRFTTLLFTINTVEIKAQPSAKVKNGSPMSIICQADISKKNDFQLRHNFTVFKNGKLVFMITSDKGEARYGIPMARSSDTGDYECTVEAGGKMKSSNSLHVWVTGMTKPILTAEKKEVLEGEVVKLRCELPEEEPPLTFFFRKINMNSTPKEKHVSELYRNFSTTEFAVEDGDNILHFDCFGRRYVNLELETSEPSNRTLVTVKEPFIKPTLIAKPSRNITEGDRMQIECSTVVAQIRGIEIILQKNKTILNSVHDEKHLKYSTVATVEDSGEYLCKVEQGRASKMTKLNVVVAELFPKPVLTASAFRVDENKELTLSCSISGFRKANFSILRRNSNGDLQWLKNSRNLTMRVYVNNTGSYICKAEVKGIVKESKPIRINVYGELIWRFRAPWKPLWLICRSVMGTPPITFTFYKGGEVKKIVVNNTYATFLDENIRQNDIGGYKCDARNHHSSGMKTSNVLNITVIGKNASLGSNPYGEVEDGSDALFLCTVEEGSWPIHFKIFKKTDRDDLVYETSENADRILWHKKVMKREDTGTYYCIASNRANVDGLILHILKSMRTCLLISVAAGSHPQLKTCNTTKKYLLGIFGAGPDLESAEVEYTEVEVSTLDPHRGNKLFGLYDYVL
uniref:Platelet endothelial cell adhesion molecule n=1 Tax=Nothoprocta perdicaria TaxID=30464 RepID=A0A8C6Z024_NOTPE